MWLKQQLPLKKSTITSVIILVILAIMIGLLAASDFSIVALSIPVVITALVLITICLQYPLIGFYFIIAASFFAFLPDRLFHMSLSVSTGIDILFLFVFVGTLRETKITQAKGSLIKAPVSVLLILYALFFIVEAFNPNLLSEASWALYARKFATYLIAYFIAYRLLDTREKVKFFYMFWLVFAFITALYGCYQQWFGLTGFEMRELMNDPHEFKLIYQGGMFRKFSLLTDPVQFGVFSGAMAVVAAILALGQKEIKTRSWLLVMAFFMTLGMLYSGTRTALVVIPCGIALFGLMTIHHKRTLLVLSGSFLFGLFLFLLPIDNPVLNRMKSVLDPNEASLNIRDINRHYIQPYIYSHPIGGGMGTSGFDGVRFNQGHPLAGFPPDSGLLKYAIETGWIGLILIMSLYLGVLCQGINYYYRSKDKEIKVYILATVVFLFSVIVTQYSQVSVGQLPYVVFFFSSMSILKRLREFDTALINKTV